MLFNVLTAATFLAATALAELKPLSTPYKLAKMSLNQAFGLMARQDQGYQPTQTECGAGADCPTACGADTVQCASNDDALHCYEPSLGETCCPDGFGNACDEGYYCTDNSDGTWCCPNGITLSDCAALYSLTGALTSETTAAPSTSASPTSPASAVMTSTSSTVSVSTTKSSTTTTPTPTYSQISNGTLTTSSTAIQFTGAANHLSYGAIPVLAVAAGAAMAL